MNLRMRHTIMAIGLTAVSLGIAATSGCVEYPREPEYPPARYYPEPMYYPYPYEAEPAPYYYYHRRHEHGEDEDHHEGGVHEREPEAPPIRARGGLQQEPTSRQGEVTGQDQSHEQPQQEPTSRRGEVTGESPKRGQQ